MLDMCRYHSDFPCKIGKVVMTSDRDLHFLESVPSVVGGSAVLSTFARSYGASCFHVGICLRPHAPGGGRLS